MKFFQWLFIIGATICMVCACIFIVGLTMAFLQSGIVHV